MTRDDLSSIGEMSEESKDFLVRAMAGRLSEEELQAHQARMEELSTEMDAIESQMSRLKENAKKRVARFAFGYDDAVKTYAIRPAPFVRSKPWRHRLSDTIAPMLSQLADAPELEFETAADLLKLLPLAQTLLVDAIDEVFELVVMYHPDLEADREWIEQHASEDQIVSAFWRIVEIADPFGIRQLLKKKDEDQEGDSDGPEKSATSESSPMPSGDSTPPGSSD